MTGQPPETSQPFTMPFQAGDVVGGKYEVRKLIGVGSIGFVISALRNELGDEVALKFLRPEYSTNPDLVARFAREARFAARIKSEHVARVFDVGNLESGAPFIVMERLEGRDLWQVLSDGGPLPVELAVEYALQTCEALASAHANGIVHRDIKPENLFLTRLLDGRSIIKVLDFGISKVALTGSLHNTVPLIRTLAALGSPVYMSPEQIRASKDVDARADIWALGCVLYELLSGSAAFDAPSLMQICAMILEKDPVPVRRRVPGIDPGLEALVVRCLEKEPALRFRDVGDLAVALAAYAPEHARVWADRCRHMLNAGKVSRVDAEDTDVGRARSGSSGGVAISIAAPPGRATASEEIPAFRSPFPWKRALVPATAACAVAAIWYAVRAPSDVALHAAPHIEPVALQPAPTPATPPPPEPFRAEPPLVPPPPVATQPEPAPSPPVIVRTVRKPIAPPASSAKAPPPNQKTRTPAPRSPETVESEPDVGF